MTDSRLFIEPITDTDLMARLHGLAFDRPFEKAWSAEAFAGLLDKAQAQAYGHADGFILLQPLTKAAGAEAGDAKAGDAEAWEIITLAVAPAARRNGLATALLTHAFDIAAAAPIWLEVAADNAAACALYRQSGFVETGRRKGYYKRAGQKRVDALLMQKTKAQG